MRHVMRDNTFTTLKRRDTTRRDRHDTRHMTHQTEAGAGKGGKGSDCEYITN